MYNILSQSPVMAVPIHLDGTMLEGGGQLFRVALSFSALTGIPVHVTNIRGKRAGKAGGIKPAHLAGAEWLARATGAETSGLEVKSRELTFRPTRRREQGENLMSGSKEGIPSVWKGVYDDSRRLVRWESFIHMSTPGSIFLVLQAVLPYILLCAPTVPTDTPVLESIISDPVPLQITIEGGTNVSNSPSFEYIEQVLLPMLNFKVGIPFLSMKLNKRGWSQGRLDIGSVTFRINPLQHGFHIPSFSFTERGELAQIHVFILAPGTTIRKNIKEKVIEHIIHRHPGVEILFPRDEDSMHPKRLYLLLVAETTSGYRLGRDWLFDRKGDFLKVADQLVLQVVEELDEELARGGCVDEYLQDQLVVFQALAQGKSLVHCGMGTKPSLHTQTVRWVGQKILGLKFDNEGACEGISYKSGERYCERHILEADANLVREFGNMNL